MSGRIEFATLTDDDSLDRREETARKKSGEVTPLKNVATKNFDFPVRTEGLQLIVLMFIIASFCITVALAVEIIIGESQVPAHGAVSTSSALCSNVGLGLLKKNGNAVDAAIGTMLCSMVVSPYGSGLGGGGFMIIHDHNSKTHPTTAFDFRETVPQGLYNAIDSKTKNVMDYMTRKRGLRVGVPGELIGMKTAHDLYGRLTWSELFAPAIALAEDGFSVSHRFAYLLRKRVDSETPSKFRTMFTNPATGELFREGEKMYRRDLAKLFKRLQKNGVAAFYNGSIAEEIVDEVRSNSGVMELKDLSSYRVAERKPLVGNFLNYTVITMPAPSSGSLLLYTLNSVENIEAENALSADYLALLTKVTKDAFHCRALLGDSSETAEIQVNEQMIINKSILQQGDLCENVAAKGLAEDHGTAHVSVIDKNEMLVSFTSTLNSPFGSMIVTQSGILLNDELMDFSNPDQGQNKFNNVEPNKRPLSSMVPTIVYHESRPCLRRFSIGGINGTRTLSSVVQTLINIVKFDMEPREAIHSPKVYCDENSCEIESFDGVDDVLPSIRSRLTAISIKVADEKLAGIGVTSKHKTNIQTYFEPIFGGLGSQY